MAKLNNIEFTSHPNTKSQSSLCHCHCICLSRYLSVDQVVFSHHSDQMPQRLKVSNIARWKCSLNVFVIEIVIVIVFVFVFVVAFFGQVIFSHHSDKMSQWSRVSKFALSKCSLNVFVIVFFIVFVVFFVCWSGYVFSWPPISFPRFRFGLEGRKALNPTQPICQNSHLPR